MRSLIFLSFVFVLLGLSTAEGGSAQLMKDGKVKLRIEPQDPVGVYSAEATVHDKIKKVDLTLRKTFDVSK